MSVVPVMFLIEVDPDIPSEIFWFQLDGALHILIFMSEYMSMKYLQDTCDDDTQN